MSVVSVRCDIELEEVKKLVRRASSTGSRILFQEFCTNFLGLPDGFFTQDFGKVPLSISLNHQS